MSEQNGIERQPGVNSGEMTPFEQVRALMQDYKSIADIPDEALAAVNYYRAENGTLAPIGHEVVDKQMSLEQKNAEKPFEPFSVAVGSERQARYITADLRERFQVLERRMERLIETDWLEYLGKDSLAQQIYAGDVVPYDFDTPEGFAESLIRKVAAEQVAYCRYYYMYTSKYFFTLREEKTYIPLAERVPFDEFDEGVWSPETARILSSEIELRRSHLADVDELEHEHKARIWSDVALTEEGFIQNVLGFLPDGYVESMIDAMDQEGVDYAEATRFLQDVARDYVQKLRKEGITTLGQLGMKVIGEWLDVEYGKPGQARYAAEAMELRSVEDAATWVRGIQEEAQAAIRKEVKLAKAALKNVAAGSEARTESETELNIAKRRLKAINRKLQPLIDVFEQSKLIAREVNKLCDQMQEVLISTGESEYTFTFVSDIDEELDKDPGKVSGDCTESAPLPFLRADNGLYNVKVFAEDSHIGNIYLLQVKDDEGQPYIWHLDAIQIPKYLAWGKAASQIRDAFIQQAQQRGVQHLTINSSEHHISNYNYISEAFKGLSTEMISSGAVYHAIATAAEKTNATQDNKDTLLQASLTDSYLRLM